MPKWRSGVELLTLATGQEGRSENRPWDGVGIATRQNLQSLDRALSSKYWTIGHGLFAWASLTNSTLGLAPKTPHDHPGLPTGL